MTAAIEIFVYPQAWPTPIPMGGDAARPGLPRCREVLSRLSRRPFVAPRIPIAADDQNLIGGTTTCEMCIVAYGPK
jgi:hypothetical protein